LVIDNKVTDILVPTTVLVVKKYGCILTLIMW